MVLSRGWNWINNFSSNVAEMKRGSISRIKLGIKRLIGGNVRPYRCSQPRKHRSPKINHINQIFLAIVNKERRKRRLAPVVFNQRLEEHARHWSRKMATEGHLSHSVRILENVCMVPGRCSQQTLVKRMFICWRKSPPHWSWMMNPSIQKAALGYWNRGGYAYGAYAFSD